MEEITSFLKHVEQQPEYDGQIVHQRTLPMRPASYGAPAADLSDGLVARLESAGITALYTHQAEAFNLVKEGKNLLAVSGTASGKSLCYNLPVLEEMLVNKKARALYLFPTKALAQDQLRALGELDFPGLVATYDGDTPREQRVRPETQISAPGIGRYPARAAGAHSKAGLGGAQ